MTTTKLLFGSLLLSLRSRRGFNIMLALIRTIMVIAILLNVDLTNQQVSTALIFYFFLTVLYLILSIAVENISEYPIFHLSYILIDSLSISYFMIQRGSLEAQFYLLFLLPLITTAHFLPRTISLYIFCVVLILFGITLARIQYVADGVITMKTFLDWGVRSTFLAISTFLYRLQRSLPSPKESRIVAPRIVAKQLESLMEDLNQVVPYDTISLQLLYRDRLLVVACLGFQNKRDVYRIEFPVNDPRFPNCNVISSKRWHITDAQRYPSFADGVYHATHVKTWMGIPLISPSTHELIGLISIDSKKQNAYTHKDAIKATWFAQQISLLLIEAALGPAALTQASRRDSIVEVTDIWKKQLADRVVKCTDDIQAARAITKIGREVFNVEDCSFYLKRPGRTSGNMNDVLHLVASSSIPKDEFEQHECLVTGRHGNGLTGFAVYGNRTLNLSYYDVKRSPYHAGKYEGHLKHLASGRSKQVMIVPIHNFSGDPIGALKLENKVGVASENRFSHLEQNLFELFTHSVGMILEGIRLRNYSNRQRQNVHNLSSMYKDIVARINNLTSDLTSSPLVPAETIEVLRKSASYVRAEMDYILAEPADYLYLENDGLLPALQKYVLLLQEGMPNYYHFKVSFLSGNARDVLPYHVKATLFKIGREAIVNALRHSRVDDKVDGKIEIEFDQVEGTEQRSYVLKIMDNGVGFSVDEKRRLRTSYGLFDMFENQQKILKKAGTRSKVVIDSAPSRGTIVKAIWTPGK